MENNKRKRWQNGKVLMAGVLSAAMILQPMTVLAADTQADETEKKVVPSEAEIAANDDILYVANCGTADPTVTPSDTKFISLTWIRKKEQMLQLDIPGVM